jgi:hypothetical protein
MKIASQNQPTTDSTDVTNQAAAVLIRAISVIRG